jgi:glycosyltransferase involved in cell wall biosynthesis
MIGDGPLLTTLKAKYPHIRYDGALFGKELAQAYGEADVLAFTSKSDTFGIVMIESMATGTPVAAYPVRGPLEVIDQGKTGFVDDELTVAISKCLTLNRNDVILNSMKWCWASATDKFISNLVPIK